MARLPKYPDPPPLSPREEASLCVHLAALSADAACGDIRRADRDAACRRLAFVRAQAAKAIRLLRRPSEPKADKPE